MMQSVVRPLIWGTLGAIAIVCFAYGILAMSIPSRAASCAGQIVVASYYGLETCKPGKRCETATGEKFDGKDLTAAMPSRKYLGRTYRVSLNGRSVKVRINDVGPAAWTKRGIDVSEAVARKLRFIRAGTASVCIERLT